MLMGNYAFIDGQNLHLWVKADGREIDLSKFMVYLQNKFNVTQAFYYIWFHDPQHEQLYQDIEWSGFTIVFKQQTVQSLSKKKGNVDSDLIFEVMRLLIKEPESFEKIVLVTWDWDFKILVDFLIQENRFKKIIFPNKKWSSSVYKKLHPKYYDRLFSLKAKIENTNSQ
jgi:uncharacterized LabA/DUF88 family protein